MAARKIQNNPADSSNNQHLTQIALAQGDMDLLLGFPREDKSQSYTRGIKHNPNSSLIIHLAAAIEMISGMFGQPTENPTDHHTHPQRSKFVSLCLAARPTND
jgi:hypothetical protein